MPLLAVRGNGPAGAYGFGAASGEQLGGMVLITPTSITSTGTGNSSSIGANGSVTFSSCSTLSLNGVFTSEYNNYRIIMRHTATVNSGYFNMRMRASGTDATASNYYVQELQIDGTSISASRGAASSSFVGATWVDTGTRSGTDWMIYGPQLAAQTAVRGITASGAANGFIFDTAQYHALSTSYDGFSLIANSTQRIEGLIAVYGLVGA